MSAKIESVCFVIDSPMNAMMASLIARDAIHIEIIYVFDSRRKDLSEYLRVCRALLSGLTCFSEEIIDFDSARFWGGEKNDILPVARQALVPLIKRHPKGTVYFGNCLTNPVALALKRFANIEHLYHAPGDFVSMLFSKENQIKSMLKNSVKRILGLELYKIEGGNFPIYTLLNFASQKRFEYLDFNDFSSNVVEEILAELRRALNVSNKNIMLLLAGDEPEPGDKNPSNIAKYIKPHYQAVEALMKSELLESAVLWIKEHKSYFSLTDEERSLIDREFSKLGCSVRFVADYLSHDYRSLPGECIIKYCKVNFVIAEPSAFLFNIASSSSVPIAAVTFFAPYRDEGQISRNAEFIGINNLLNVPSRVY